MGGGGWVLARFVGMSLLAVALLASAGAALARDRHVIPRLGTLELSPPPDWQVKFVYREDLSDYPRWYLAPMGERLQLFLTLMWPRPGRVGPPAIPDLLARVGRRVLSLSDQTRLRIIQFPSDAHALYYYDLSDRSAQPPEYRYLRQGAVVLDTYVLVFTLLQNQPDTGDTERVMKMLAGLSWRPLAGI